MVQILEQNPSFSALLGRGLGQGFSQGVSKGAEFAQKMAVAKRQDPYREMQQFRLAADSKYKQLSGFIREADNILKDPFYPFAEGEKERIKQQRDQVSDQRNEIFALSSKLEESQPTKKKPKFSKKSPSHMAKFEQLVKDFGKDEKKVREVLSREFDLD